MPTPIVLNPWPTGPTWLSPVQWEHDVRMRTLAVLTFAELCKRADLTPGTDDPALLQRYIHVLDYDDHLCPQGRPWLLGVALRSYQGTEADALRVLETLAYGFFDPAARATVKGRGLYVAPPK